MGTIDKINKNTFTIIIPIFGIILFGIFSKYLSFIIFNELAFNINKIICRYFNLKISSGVFGFGNWIYKIPIILWIDAFIFFIVSFIVLKINNYEVLKNGFKINLILFLFSFLYFSFKLLEFYFSL